MKRNPFFDLLGAKLEVWKEGYVEVCLPVSPDFLNTAMVLHGGVTAALLDTVCGMAGLYNRDESRQRVGSTLSLTISYLDKGVGERMTGKGFMQRQGRSVFFSRGEVWTESGILIATAQGVFSHATLPA
ncbi:PaaI family thioesterase [Pandoraea nosoerga]|uniref:Phenylacetic acid degradation protein n=1 Tax=Pandoraea nosoerga TaxID=2508296 RepID=A0A5E4W3K4_9BURK|nr:PaaI family thioesterase [Pandoraea nosoerga]VVE18216.1 phenylacetic acid degradation protein [Pandoraea nosoerga]